jgi:APA family basic amino acid/polyamine antiporter
MYKLGWINWARLIIWLVIGMFIYFLYGVKNSKVQAMPEAMQTGRPMVK